MTGFRYAYSDEQRKAVKNLNVSINILLADIRKLTDQLATADEPTTKVINDKIAYKESRIAEKSAKRDEIKNSVEKTPITRATKAPKVEAEAEATVTEEM